MNSALKKLMCTVYRMDIGEMGFFLYHFYLFFFLESPKMQTEIKMEIRIERYIKMKRKIGYKD